MMLFSDPWAMYPEGYPSVDVVGESGKWCANPKTEVVQSPNPSDSDFPDICQDYMQVAPDLAPWTSGDPGVPGSSEPFRSDRFK